MNWKEYWKEYAVIVGMEYRSNPPKITTDLRWPSISGCLNESYLSLVREKELIPIELLEESEKIRLWTKAKGLGEGKRQCIEISRSIYLLEQLTK